MMSRGPDRDALAPYPSLCPGGGKPFPSAREVKIHESEIKQGRHVRAVGSASPARGSAGTRGGEALTEAVGEAFEACGKRLENFPNSSRCHQASS